MLFNDNYCYFIALYLINHRVDSAVNISITKHFEEIVNDLIHSGRYASASEVVRAGLRLIEEQEQERQAKLQGLRLAIQEGIDSGPAVEFDGDDIIARGRARTQNGAETRDLSEG
ncbi:MAG: antitoxin ParD1/3/4 [Rhodothermales bacterium]